MQFTPGFQNFGRQWKPSDLEFDLSRNLCKTACQRGNPRSPWRLDGICAFSGIGCRRVEAALVSHLTKLSVYGRSESIRAVGVFCGTEHAQPHV